MLPIVIQISNINNSILNRSFREIAGKAQIEYLLQKLLAQGNANIVLSTSDEEIDDIFEKIAKAYGTGIVRAEYSEILKRLYLANTQLNSDCVIRVLGNYPLLDVCELKRLYEEHIAGAYDYSFNEHGKGVLWGTGCEVFSKGLIECLIGKKLSATQQKTLSFYVRQNEEAFRINKAIRCEKRPGYKLCLETEKDYEVIRELADNIPAQDGKSIWEYLDSHKILAKYNYENPPQEVGVEKLFFHSQKMDSLLEEKDMAYPISVELTLTNVCNLNCCFCSDKDLRTRQGMNRSLKVDTLKRLFDDLVKGGTTGITIEGGGEPTLYPNFQEVVEYAKSVGLAVGLITNGTIRLPEDLLSQFEWIRVSLDASNNKEYLDLKGVDFFEKVLANIAHYVKYCKTVGVGYVVTKNNISQLESLVMRLRELKASYIQLRPVVDCEELYPTDVDLSYLRLYQNQDFAVMIGGMTENAEKGNNHLPCVANGITSVISGDGAVYLCGRLNIYNWLKPVGNINEEDFHKIWNGEERRRQCEMVRDPEFCNQNCPQCRVSKYNQFINKLVQINTKNFI